VIFSVCNPELVLVAAAPVLAIAVPVVDFPAAILEARQRIREEKI
jgi:hypothetical protein